MRLIPVLNYSLKRNATKPGTVQRQAAARVPFPRVADRATAQGVGEEHR